MISRYEAYMDGIALSGIHPGIMILDIGHSVPNSRFQTAAMANRHGNSFLSEHVDGAGVHISMELHIYSIAERQRVCQEIQRWARGSVLEVNDRPGQRLNVRCTAFPGIESALMWTDPVEVDFAAFEKPFWEEKAVSSLTLPAGTSGSDYLFVPGNAGDTLCEITVTPESGNTLNTIGIGCGTTVLNFSDLGATNSNPLKVRYNDKQIMSIKVGTTSAMGKRTAASADDILMKCGEKNLCSYSANVSVTATFSARGLWL